MIKNLLINKIRSLKNKFFRKGENFLDFYTTKKLAKGSNKEIVNFVWDNKPIERRKVPENCFKRISEIINFEQRPLNLLELGPGTGRFTLEAFKFLNVGNLWLVDTNLDWLNYCKYLLKKENFQNTFLICNDGEKILGIKKNSIDLCNAHAVFIILKHQRTFEYFRQISMLLKKNGILFCDLFILNDASIMNKSGPDWAVFWEESWLNDICNLFGLTIIDHFDSFYGDNYKTRYLIIKKN